MTALIMVSLLYAPLYFENGFNSGSYFSISSIWAKADDVRFTLYQHAQLDFDSATTLKTLVHG
jgi:hypothetical protein